MKSQILYKGETIEYDLQYKKVKNINLRIKPDSSVHVSASKRVNVKFIDDFVCSKAELVLRAVDKFKNASVKDKHKYFSENELKTFINDCCQKIYPYYEKLGIAYPIIKFRKMRSRWGTCNSTRGILTFSENLIYAPSECVKYVVLHEFTHFLVQNHSEYFYCELAKVCPDYKLLRRKLKEIVIC